MCFWHYFCLKGFLILLNFVFQVAFSIFYVDFFDLSYYNGEDTLIKITIWEYFVTYLSMILIVAIKV